MADQSAQGEPNKDGQGTTGASTSGAGDKPTQITMTPEQLEARLDRERAKYADYDSLKDAAKRLEDIEAANKSELEKATDARQKAEQERDAARAEALRFKVASKHGISDEDAELFLTGSDEATLTKQAERLSARDADRKKTGNYVPREGANPSADGSDDAAFVRQLFAGD